MRKTMFIVLLGISTVALGALCLVQRQQVRRLIAQRVAPVPAVARDPKMKNKPPVTAVEQEDQLIRAMHDARIGFKGAVADFGGQQEGTAPSQFTPEVIAKLLEKNAKLQEQYVAKAAAILTPAQLEMFTANQKQQQAMQEMGMNMAAKMFGQPAKAKVPVTL